VIPQQTGRFIIISSSFISIRVFKENHLGWLDSMCLLPTFDGSQREGRVLGDRLDEV